MKAPPRSKARRKPGRGGPEDPITSLVERAKWLAAVLADVAATRRAPPEDKLTADALVVAVALADHINAKLGYAWPKLSTLETLTGLRERGIRGLVDQLVALGHLHVKVSKGPGASNRYWLLLQDSVPAVVDDGSNPGENRHGGAGSSDAGIGENRHDGAGSHEDPNGENRHGYAGENRHRHDSNTGTAMPPTSPTTKSIRTASPFLPEPEQARQADDVEKASSQVADRSQVSSDPERREADNRWAAAVGAEVAVVLAEDPDGTGRLWVAITAGRFAVEDVDAGIGDWTRNGNIKPNFWGFFSTWAVKAAERRLAQTPKAESVPSSSGRLPAQDHIRLEGGVYRTRQQIEVAVANWHAGQAWDAHLGFPPDSEFTTVPVDLRGPRRLH